MGASSSYVRHVSKPTDAVPNLVWALQTLVEWEESCRFLKLDIAHEHKDLGARFLFVHSLLEQLVSLSVDVLKLKSRLDNWTDKPATAASPKERYQRQKDIDSKMERLLESLRSYDNARSACQWLRHDFTLERELTELRELMPPDDVEPELLTIDSEMVKLNEQKEEHHRRLLEVSLHYIDRHAPYGSIEPEDLPSLSAHLFNLLDNNSKHSITTKSLRATLATIDTNLAKHVEMIETLTAKGEIIEEKHTQLQSELNAFPPAESKQQVKQRNKLQLNVDQAYVDGLSLMGKLEQAQTGLAKLKEDKKQIFATFSTAFVEDMTTKLEFLEQTNVAEALTHVFSRHVKMRDIAIGTANTDIKIGAFFREGEQELKEEKLMGTPSRSEKKVMGASSEKVMDDDVPEKVMEEPEKVIKAPSDEEEATKEGKPSLGEEKDASSETSEGEEEKRVAQQEVLQV